MPASNAIEMAGETICGILLQSICGSCGIGGVLATVPKRLPIVSTGRWNSCTTAAVTINENADPNIGTDFLNALRKMIVEHDGWLHDRIDDNAAAHIKSALVGPSVVIPISAANLSLGTWQNVFLCEFDGPRTRQLIVSVVS